MKSDSKRCSNPHCPNEWVVFPTWICDKCHHINESEQGESGSPPVCENCKARNPDFKYSRKKSN